MNKIDQEVILFNTSTFNRFDHYKVEVESTKQNYVGKCMIPGLGYAKVSKEVLENSGQSSALKLRKSEKGFVIENRFYEIEISNYGGILSWKEKRVAHTKGI